MSQAFVKESDDNGMLHQINPTIPSLVNYIRAENNNAAVYVKNVDIINGVQVIAMSNGFSYFINKENNWEMYL